MKNHLRTLALGALFAGSGSASEDYGMRELSKIEYKSGGRKNRWSLSGLNQRQRRKAERRNPSLRK